MKETIVRIIAHTPGPSGSAANGKKETPWKIQIVSKQPDSVESYKMNRVNGFHSMNVF
jgi:hypothetical protein